MNTFAKISIASVVLFAPFVVGVGRAEEPAPSTQPVAAPASEEAAMMQAWGAFMTPGKEHADLAKMVGNWNAVGEDYTSGQKTEFKGTAKFTMLLGGRYLQQEMDSVMFGMPFQGIGITGYDNAKKKFVETWIDSAGTGIGTSEGTQVGDKMESVGSMTDPVSGKPKPYRSIASWVNPDTHVFEMHMPGRDGKEALAMRITYTRVKP